MAQQQKEQDRKVAAVEDRLKKLDRMALSGIVNEI
jgi:hypothetical protein